MKYEPNPTVKTVKEEGEEMSLGNVTPVFYTVIIGHLKISMVKASLMMEYD